MRLLTWSMTALVFTLSGSALSQTAPDFNRDVRPILSRHCFKCHGPDDLQRKGGLSLLSRAGALAKLPSGGRAVVPGKPWESSLLKRIDGRGGALMPPPTENKPLSAAQKETLKAWVKAGSPYQEHWAFVPPKSPTVPNAHKGWAALNPIDSFIHEKLADHGLTPSREAERSTLIRRVSLDLIGLPPTPEEVASFVADKQPGAYERVVDRLLASPHYGERWARRWLDLARYADTNGYEKDRPRTVWPYRDWVINALNADLPFNQFTVEQLAGDMLPQATIDQRIATGFNRNTMLNEEGGIDPLEFRYYSMVDRMNAVGTAWLGLSVGCCQCHTHKFDPLPQRDYYRMMAYLDNADEPEIDILRPETVAKRNEIEEQAVKLESALASKFPAAEGRSSSENLAQRLSEWIAANEKAAVRWQVVRPTKATSNLPLLTLQSDDSILVSGDQSKRDVYTLQFAGVQQPITAIRIEALPDDRLPKHGPGRVYYEGPFGDFFLSEITAKSATGNHPFARAMHTFAAGSFEASKAIDGDPQSGWMINGGQGKAHSAVFVLKEPIPAGRLELEMLFERYHACNLGRFRISVATDPITAQAALPPTVEAALATAANQRTAQQRSTIQDYFLQVCPELKSARDEIAKVRTQAPALPTAWVFEERPPENPRTTYIRKRGEFLQPLDKVTPGIFAPLSTSGAPIPKNRLEFAQWLVSPQNPLTARVVVNRQWQAFFGKGLVRTLEDFGYQGAAPTHSALLDWLAVQFSSKSGFNWSMKKLHRLIVTSATYRQESAVTPEHRAKDPNNVWLAHMPRLRLDAELLRDQALAVSGLLSRKLGGPSVFPPQPASVTSEGAYGSLQWKVSEGEDRYRRGLYTFAKRTAPYAMFQTFDGPSGEAVCPRRETTNTPLQALTTLNDEVFLECHRALGARIAKLEDSTENKARRLFLTCTSRDPKSSELASLMKFYSVQKGRIEAKQIDPATVMGGAGDPESAAWSLVARSVMNLDEVVVRR